MRAIFLLPLLVTLVLAKSIERRDGVQDVSEVEALGRNSVSFAGRAFKSTEISFVGQFPSLEACVDMLHRLRTPYVAIEYTSISGSSGTCRAVESLKLSEVQPDENSVIYLSVDPHEKADYEVLKAAGWSIGDDIQVVNMTALQEAWQAAVAAGKQVGADFKDWWQRVSSSLGVAAKILSRKFRKFIDKVVNHAKETVSGVKESVGQHVDQVESTIDGVLSNLGDKIGKIKPPWTDLLNKH